MKTALFVLVSAMLGAAVFAADAPASVVSRVKLANAPLIVVRWSDGRLVTNAYTEISGSRYVTTLPSGQVTTNAIWWKTAAVDRASKLSSQSDVQIPYGKNASAVDVWLTPERAAALKRITKRPYISSRQMLDADTAVLRWRDGSKEWATTNRVKKILGKPAKNAWQDRLDAKEAEKKSILDDLEVVKAKPTKKAIEDIITKSKKGSAK